MNTKFWPYMICLIIKDILQEYSSCRKIKQKILPIMISFTVFFPQYKKNYREVGLCIVGTNNKDYHKDNLWLQKIMSHYKLKPSFICNSIIFYRIFFFGLEILPQSYFAVPSIWEQHRNSDASVRRRMLPTIHLPDCSLQMEQPDISLCTHLKHPLKGSN